MKCEDCRHGKFYAIGAVYCTLYGMIIRAEHECTLEREIWTDEDISDGGERKTEIHDDGGRAAGEVPGVLSESGERGGFSGVDEESRKGGGLRIWRGEDS